MNKVVVLVKVATSYAEIRTRNKTNKQKPLREFYTFYDLFVKTLPRISASPLWHTNLMHDHSGLLKSFRNNLIFNMPVPENYLEFCAELALTH